MNNIDQPLVFKNIVDEDCKKLLKKLLNPEQKRRLGYNQHDYEELKKQDFFKGIDWCDVENKRVASIYKPCFCLNKIVTFKLFVIKGEQDLFEPAEMLLFGFGEYYLYY
ncbi:Serine/threonine-protein kinase Sgk1 [Bonamia ostreae]|uniref:Serine/threonine-protein kinase Sgk1 n=1 Tax=Bonamia ostreae TaxID=126728 RepID=A0ABV2AMU6_9EUKA